jgi:hypothetical protein
MNKREDCRWAEALLARAQEGEQLSASETERLQDHVHNPLTGCASCQNYAMRLSATASAVQELPAAMGSEQSGGRIAARAVAQWAQEQSADTVKRPALRWQPLTAVGFACVLGGVAWVALPHRAEQEKQAMSPAPSVPVLSTPVPKLPKKSDTFPDLVAPREDKFASAFQAPQSNRAIYQPEVAPRIMGGFTSPHQAKVRVAMGQGGPEVKNPGKQASDDLLFINDGPEHSRIFTRRYSGLSRSEVEQLQAEIDRTIRTGDDFITVPFPQVALSNSSTSRLIASEAVRRYRQEKAVVDPRLMRKITLAEKGIAFSDLCAKLKAETGIEFRATRNVMDDKVTIFCKDRPLRDLMRAITRVFDFAWERKGEDPNYSYALFQPMRAQLSEEEMRNHDRNEALIELDRQMEKFRAHLDMSPAEAREAAKSASKEDAKMYEALANGWGPVHMYFAMSPEQSAALHAGQSVKFGGTSGNGLPEEVSQGIVQSLNNRAWVLQGKDGKMQGVTMGGSAPKNGTGIPINQAPNLTTLSDLKISPTELGQFQLMGGTGFRADGVAGMMTEDMATGISPSVKDPKNAEANADLAKENDMRAAMTPLAKEEAGASKASAKKNITSADLLEAFHRSTGRDVIGDYYTRLYEPDVLARFSAKQTVFQALCHVSDAARLRWGRDENWLTFRSASFFNDRPKEVPARLLDRWKEARQGNSNQLPLNSLCEIASLSDTQLDAAEMGEAIKALYGLSEWSLVKAHRGGWRLLAGLPSSLRAMTAQEKGDGLKFEVMPPDIQERYAHEVLGDKLDLTEVATKLAGATLQVDYQPEVAATTTPEAPAKEATFSFTYRYNFRKDGKFTKRTVTQYGMSQSD